MCACVDDIIEHNFDQLVTDYFGRLNLNAGVQKLLAVSNLMHMSFPFITTGPDIDSAGDMKLLNRSGPVFNWIVLT